MLQGQSIGTWFSRINKECGGFSGPLTKHAPRTSNYNESKKYGTVTNGVQIEVMEYV
jgi:hypothetical protein